MKVTVVGAGAVVPLYHYGILRPAGSGGLVGGGSVAGVADLDDSAKVPLAAVLVRPLPIGAANNPQTHLDGRSGRWERHC